MKERKDRRVLIAICLDILVGFILWVALLALKIAGLVSMGWFFVLTGFVWISWLMMALSAAAFGLQAAWEWLLKKRPFSGKSKIYDWEAYRAAADGEWYSLRDYEGRDLDVHAWEHYGLRRQPGESDKELRRRCKKVTAYEYLGPKEG